MLRSRNFLRGVVPLHTDVSGPAPEDAFGSFRVLHQIGAGVLGSVFRAYDPERDRLVAVKLFRLDAPPDRVHRLVAEFEKLVAAELTHPSLAAPIEAGIVGASAYLAQEYVAGESLDITVRDHGPVAASEALRIAAQLASGLDFGAVAGIAHGALHPRDVMLSSDAARLTGIGIARALEQIAIVLPVRRPYTAPERMAASSWDRRADVFGLAAVMHEMLWGRRITAIGAQAAEALTGLPGSDLDELRRVFGRALAEDPLARYETALEFVQEIRHAFPDLAIGSRHSTVVSRQSTAAGRQSIVDSRESTGVERLTPDELTPDDRLTTDGRLTMDGQSTADNPLTTDDQVMADDGPATDDRRLWTDAEPRLPLDELRHDDRQVAVVPPDSTAVRFANVETASKPTPAPLSVYEQSRSAVWPLVLALGVGAALGFAGGYGVGIYDRPVVTLAARTGTAEPTPSQEALAPTPEPDVVRNAQSASAPTGPPQPDLAGRLLVRSTPAGAQVFVDGRDYGRTPVTVRDIAPGTHRVRLVRDGYGAEERRVLISTSAPSQSVTLRLSPTAPSRRAEGTARGAAVAPASGERGVSTLTVESKPSGAQVFVDNRLVGATPLSLSEMAAGEHTVRLEIDGYRRWSSSIRIAASERHRVTASLEK